MFVTYRFVVDRVDAEGEAHRTDIVIEPDGLGGFDLRIGRGAAVSFDLETARNIASVLAGGGRDD